MYVEESNVPLIFDLCHKLSEHENFEFEGGYLGYTTSIVSVETSFFNFIHVYKPK